MYTLKICLKCGIEKASFEFKQKRKNSTELTKWCISCLDKSKDTQKKYRENNPDKYAEIRNNYAPTMKVKLQEYYEAHKEEIKASVKEWSNNNKDKRYEIHRKYYSSNTGLAKQRTSLWRINNKGRHNFNNRSRKYKQLRCTPKWADAEKIKKIYEDCPSGYHVDHIIPIVNSVVCGLHVPDNLQYLPASINCSKSNRFDQELFC